MPLPRRTAAGASEGAPGYCGAVPFLLESTAFATGERIPARYTCDGEDARPTLGWVDPPLRSQEFLILVEDRDAPSGSFLHFSAWGLPRSLRQLPESVVPPAEGRNDFGVVGWRGPCPPRGQEHHYVFRIIALDRPLGLAPGASRAEIQPLIAERFLAEAELVGRYSRI